jgi:hypothetical protein
MGAKPIARVHSDDVPGWDDLRHDPIGFVRDVLQVPIADWQAELLMQHDECHGC